MRIAIAQLDLTVGAFDCNLEARSGTPSSVHEPSRRT